jgi:hypothetical protein
MPHSAMCNCCASRTWCGNGNASRTESMHAPQGAKSRYFSPLVESLWQLIAGSLPSSAPPEALAGGCQLANRGLFLSRPRLQRPRTVRPRSTAQWHRPHTQRCWFGSSLGRPRRSASPVTLHVVRWFPPIWREMMFRGNTSKAKGIYGTPFPQRIGD